MSRPYLLVGLTGGIATGKSTVSAMFRALGCVVIDADLLAREVVEPGEPALADIVHDFGPGMLKADGQLDRQALGAVVFGDAARRRRLEAITHPRIRERFARRLETLAAERFEGIVIFDAAVLVESGNWKTMDRLVVVVADDATQIARLQARNGIGREEALRRIQSQMPLGEKARLAHYVIDNSGDRAATEAQVRWVYEALQQEARTARRLGLTPLPLAALFFRDAAHYGRNAFDPKAAASSLCRATPNLSWVAYHRSPPSAVLVMRDPGREGLEEAARAAQSLFGLGCVPRTFADLIRLARSTPGGTTTTARGSMVVRQGQGYRKVVAVLLDREVPRTHRCAGRLSPRVEAVTWASSRDIVCLYDRPSKGGSNGQVERAVARALVVPLSGGTIVATARAMRVVQDVVNGELGISHMRSQIGTGRAAASPEIRPRSQ